MGAPLQRVGEPGPVHGMHHVGIPGHRRRLVGLQLADEVDAELVTVAQLGDLGGGLLVPVLPHVTDPELREQVDVTGREELRDGDELDLLGTASHGGAGTLDARPHCGEPSGKLVAASSRADQLDDPRETAGLAVAAVGVQPVGLPRAARNPLNRNVIRAQLRDDPGRPRRWRACRTRTPRRTLGRPRRRLPASPPAPRSTAHTPTARPPQPAARRPASRITVTALSMMPAVMPGRPACTAPITPASGSARSTGVQSATRTARASPRVFVTTPSAGGGGEPVGQARRRAGPRCRGTGS